MQWQSVLDLGFLWAGRNYERAGAYFEQAVELAEELGDAALQAHTLNRYGNWLLNVGQFERAIEAHHKALTLFEELQDRAGMAETLDLLGTLTCHAGDLVNGVELYGRAIELLRTLDNRSVLSSCLAMASARKAVSNVLPMIAAVRKISTTSGDSRARRWLMAPTMPGGRPSDALLARVV